MDTESHKITSDLSCWQRDRLPYLRQVEYVSAVTDQVTIVAYHFWDESRVDAQFDYLECAILESWRHCGRLKTHLVVNRVTPLLEAFAERHSPLVSLSVNDALIPGQINTMSVDCNSNLHRYFDTEYVLVVQNDGFPLRTGLTDFVGRYDYIGAPYVRRIVLNRALGLWPRFAVGNGGFSLRSKKICERASYYWRRRFRWMPTTSRFVNEDVFYCFALPVFCPEVRRSIVYASIGEASRFSYDHLTGEGVGTLPFGFHGQAAFKYLVDKQLMNGKIDSLLV